MGRGIVVVITGGIFVFSVIVWEGIVEDFVKESFGVGVLLVEGKNRACEVPGESIPW